MSVRLVSIADACEQLGGIGRTTLYELIDQGHLVRARIGRRAFITGESIEGYLHQIEPSDGQQKAIPTDTGSPPGLSSHARVAGLYFKKEGTVEVDGVRLPGKVNWWVKTVTAGGNAVTFVGMTMTLDDDVCITVDAHQQIDEERWELDN